MKPSEFIRIVVFIVLGAALMFYLQPLIYEMRLIPIRAKYDELIAWIGQDYHTGAKIVFSVSVASTLLWYVLAAKAKVKGSVETKRWMVVWWGLLGLPILSIVVALTFFNSRNDVLLSLTGFYILDAVFLLFWLPTATSSPKALMYVPPGSFLLRRLIGG
jgi:hypothetical protein